MLSAASLGGTAIATMGDRSSMDIFDFLTASFNLLPAVLFFIGLSALALGWALNLVNWFMPISAMLF
ncbi:hypothetical protein [Oceanobacillus sp. E9]|uniref:hypothetical protein n=1 Tax=Oceanobacillus sp. E9 TaxID=1742575 RepID=UPI001969CFB9|nr:hypothetical protein [Oceanobacillus sp. E9]